MMRGRMLPAKCHRRIEDEEEGWTISCSLASRAQTRTASVSFAQMEYELKQIQEERRDGEGDAVSFQSRGLGLLLKVVAGVDALSQSRLLIDLCSLSFRQVPGLV